MSENTEQDKEEYSEEPCCWCNDEGSTDGTGETHPCAFCGAC